MVRYWLCRIKQARKRLLSLKKKRIVRFRKFRIIWTRERSQVWWHKVMNGLLGKNWWRKNLSMKKETFIGLCVELRSHISKCTTKLRQAVCIEQRVAVT